MRPHLTTNWNTISARKLTGAGFAVGVRDGQAITRREVVVPPMPLWTYLFFVAFNLLDAWLTSMTCRLDVTESNSIVRLVMQLGGPSVLWAIKAVGLIVIISTAEFIRLRFHRTVRILFIALCALTAAVVLNNLAFVHTCLIK